jgi:hypothetical protein
MNASSDGSSNAGAENGGGMPPRSVMVFGVLFSLLGAGLAGWLAWRVAGGLGRLLIAPACLGALLAVGFSYWFRPQQATPKWTEVGYWLLASLLVGVFLTIYVFFGCGLAALMGLGGIIKLE